MRMRLWQVSRAGSKAPDAPRLAFGRDTWQAFAAKVKAA
jgi:hypothetical protein